MTKSKKRCGLILLIIGFLFVMMTSFVACKGCKKEDTAVFDGVEDIRISVSVTEYDFLQGVTAQDDKGTALEITVDSSKVKFGTAGQYKVVYKTSKGKQSADVYIYGTPSIKTESLTLTYKEVATGVSRVAERVEAEDTFGGEVSVRVEFDLLNANGSVKTGAGEITAYATDEFGNEAKKNIAVTVENPVKTYSFGAQNIDFARAFKTFEIGESKLLSVYAGNDKQDAETFTCDNGYCMLLPALFKELGTGEHTLTLNFDDGSETLACVITDNQPIQIEEEFSLNNQVFVVGDTIRLPNISRAEHSIQDFEVNRYLQIADGAPQTTDKVEFVAEEKGVYAYVAEIVKDAQVVETRTQYFKVLSVKEALAENLIAERYYNYITRFSCATEYQESVTVNGVTTNAIHATTTKNTQTDSGFENYFEISKDLVLLAMQEGYTRVTVRLYSANGVCLYNAHVEAIKYRAAKSEPEELYGTWDINSFAAGIRIAIFGGAPADVYLTELRFSGAEPNFEENIIDQNTMSWISGNQCSIEYQPNAVVNGTATPAYHVYKVGGVQTQSENKNTLVIDAALMNMAAAAGYSTITIKLYTANGFAIYNTMQSPTVQNIIKYKGVANEAEAIELKYSISQVSSGMYFSIFGNDVIDMYITEIRFGGMLKFDYSQNMVSDNLVSLLNYTKVSGEYQENVTVNGVTTNAIHVTSTDSPKQNPGFRTHYFVISKDLINAAITAGYTKISVTVYTANGFDLYKANADDQYLGFKRNDGSNAAREVAVTYDLSTVATNGLYFCIGGNADGAIPVDFYITNVSFSK